MTHHLLPSLLLVFSASPQQTLMELFQGLLLVSYRWQLHGSDSHCYPWRLLMPEIILGSPLDIFSVFTPRVEATTMCTIHTLMSFLIVRAALSKNISVSIAL